MEVERLGPRPHIGTWWIHECDFYSLTPKALHCGKPWSLIYLVWTILVIDGGNSHFSLLLGPSTCGIGIT